MKTLSTIDEKILMALLKERSYLHRIIKYNIPISYGHATNRLRRLEKLGFIKFKRVGRIKWVWLSSKGEEVARMLELVYKKTNYEERGGVKSDSIKQP